MLENGKYLIRHAHVHWFRIGVDNDDEPVVPVIIDGVHDVFTIKRLENGKYTMSVDQGGRMRHVTRYFGGKGRFVTASIDGSPIPWVISRLANGHYSIAYTDLMFKEIWTVRNDQKPQERVDLVLGKAPTANEEFDLFRQE